MFMPRGQSTWLLIDSSKGWIQAVRDPCIERDKSTVLDPYPLSPLCGYSGSPFSGALIQTNKRSLLLVIRLSQYPHKFHRDMRRICGCGGLWAQGNRICRSAWPWSSYTRRARRAAFTGPSRSQRALEVISADNETWRALRPALHCSWSLLESFCLTRLYLSSVLLWTLSPLVRVSSTSSSFTIPKDISSSLPLYTPSFQ